MVRKGQWHDYENGKKKEYGEFVRKAREFTYARPAPPIYRNTTPKGGKPNKNDPRALVICLLLKIWLGEADKDPRSFLSALTYPWVLLGIQSLSARMEL